MVDEIVGSSMVIGWNRLSSAASLPIVLRYSSALKKTWVNRCVTNTRQRTSGGPDKLKSSS